MKTIFKEKNMLSANSVLGGDSVITLGEICMLASFLS